MSQVAGRVLKAPVAATSLGATSIPATTPATATPSYLAVTKEKRREI